MAAVARRSEPRKFLDASLVPLEKALRARAEVIAEDPAVVHAVIAKVARTYGGATNIQVEALSAAVGSVLAAELRALAGELHHW